MNEKETNAGQNEVETAVDTQVEEPKTINSNFHPFLSFQSIN